MREEGQRVLIVVTLGTDYLGSMNVAAERWQPSQ